MQSCIILRHPLLFCSGAIPKDFRVLPDRIFLVRHAESEGNVDNYAYTTIPDSQVPLVSTIMSINLLSFCAYSKYQ